MAQLCANRCAVVTCFQSLWFEELNDNSDIVTYGGAPEPGFAAASLRLSLELSLVSLSKPCSSS